MPVDKGYSIVKFLKVQRLAMIVAAASLLTGGLTSKVMSVEISATAFVTNLQQYVSNGQINAARDALMQLKGFGITRMKIGDAYYDIDDLLLALNDPTQAAQLLTMLAAYVENGVTARFVAQDRVVASIDWDTGELFATSSAA
jgi:hypothetical protein